MAIQNQTDEFDEEGLRKRVGSFSHEELKDHGSRTIKTAWQKIKKVERMEQLDQLLQAIKCGDYGSAEATKVSRRFAKVEIETPELTGPVDEFIRAEPTKDLEMEFNDEYQQYEIEAKFDFTCDGR